MIRVARFIGYIAMVSIILLSHSVHAEIIGAGPEEIRQLMQLNGIDAIQAELEQERRDVLSLLASQAEAEGDGAYLKLLQRRKLEVEAKSKFLQATGTLADFKETTDRVQPGELHDDLGDGAMSAMFGFAVINRARMRRQVQGAVHSALHSTEELEQLVRDNPGARQYVDQVNQSLRTMQGNLRRMRAAVLLQLRFIEHIQERVGYLREDFLSALYGEINGTVPEGDGYHGARDLLREVEGRSRVRAYNRHLQSYFGPHARASEVTTIRRALENTTPFGGDWYFPTSLAGKANAEAMYGDLLERMGIYEGDGKPSALAREMATLGNQIVSDERHLQADRTRRGQAQQQVSRGFLSETDLERVARQPFDRVDAKLAEASSKLSQLDSGIANLSKWDVANVGDDFMRDGRLADASSVRGDLTCIHSSDLATDIRVARRVLTGQRGNHVHLGVTNEMPELVRETRRVLEDINTLRHTPGMWGGASDTVRQVLNAAKRRGGSVVSILISGMVVVAGLAGEIEASEKSTSKQASQPNLQEARQLQSYYGNQEGSVDADELHQLEQFIAQEQP